MKKLSIIVLVVMATLVVISCNQQKRPKYHKLSVLTNLVLLEDEENGKYKLYDPFNDDVLASGVDTAYVGMHQIVCHIGSTKEVYTLKGRFLFFAYGGLYIFETTAGTFYAVEHDRGYKWHTAYGSEETYIFDDKLEEMLKNSNVIENFPICRWIDEKYYPEKR